MPSRARRRIAARPRAAAAKCAVALIALALPALPSTSAAQQQPPAQPADRPATHTVKRGDTLWDLARQYLSDPFQWPAIYQLNRDVVEDPHWIYPDEVLKLPGATPVVAEDPAPQPADPPRPTVFEPTEVPAEVRRARATAERPSSTVRVGEYLAAPFADRRGGPQGSGTIIETADVAGIAQAGGRTRLQLFDEVRVTPPAGATGQVRERYVAYTLGPELEDLGQIVIPTGIIEVRRAGGPGEAAVARVVQLFRDMRAGERLMPYDTSVASVTARPRPALNGPEGRIRWIADQPVLPSVQNYVIASMTTAQGVKPGDAVIFYQPRVEANAEITVARPEVTLAGGQVVRVNERGATIMIDSQRQPGIGPDTPVRVVARMP